MFVVLNLLCVIRIFIYRLLQCRNEGWICSIYKDSTTIVKLDVLWIFQVYCLHVIQEVQRMSFYVNDL